MSLQYSPPPGVGSPSYIDLTTGLADPAWLEGRIFYDDVNKTLAVYNDESDVTLQLGQEMYTRVYNDTGVAITNGELISIDGAMGGLPTAVLAKSDSPSTTGVIAMATHDIANGSIGFATTMGVVGGLDTNALAVGTVLYLSDTVAGAWASSAPNAPSFPIRVGRVIVQDASVGKILVSIGPTEVAQAMVIESLTVNNDLTITDKLILSPSAIMNITAGGGITVTNATMYIQGSGGPVTVTANPQIVVGAEGQIVHLQGKSDTNTVTIHDGDGIHLHSGSNLIIGDHDFLTLQYDTAASQWEEVSSNFKSFDTSWSFKSPAGSSGQYYLGGFYILPSTSYTPAGGTNLGTVNVAYHAHAFIVLGATSTDMIVRFTGTSVDEAGNRTASDTQDIDTSGGVLNDYFETSKKWVGQVSVSLQSGTGVAVNHGLCKYWNNQNSAFRVTGIEVTGVAGANDSAPNFEVLGHQSTGWTFNSGAAPTIPAAEANMQSDYVTEYAFSNGEPFAWKRVGLSVEIEGSGSEGIISRLTTTSNNAIQSLNWTYSIRPT